MMATTNRLVHPEVVPFRHKKAPLEATLLENHQVMTLFLRSDCNRPNQG